MAENSSRSLLRRKITGDLGLLIEAPYLRVDGNTATVDKLADIAPNPEIMRDAFFYVNGLLQGAEPLAVAITAVLVPYWWAASPDDGTGTVTKINVDYLDFWGPRPAS